MSILEKIVEHKQKEIEYRKTSVPVSELEKSPYFSRQTFSLAGSLSSSEGPGIIAEFKRSSPTKGVINAGASPGKTARDYEQGGAAGISILTDTTFFGGSIEDLKKARRVTSLPLLRKDFITEEYQVLEARAAGADAILLIAAILEPGKIKTLVSLARELGLEILFEIHDIYEIRKIPEEAELVGVNNRNLKTFTVDIQKAMDMAPLLPPDVIKISESGLGEPADIIALHKAGYRGFLIGEAFMKTKNPGETCKRFIDSLTETTL